MTVDLSAIAEQLAAIQRELGRGALAPLLDDDPYFVSPTPATDGGYVYFVLCCSAEWPIKIGYARDLGTRLSGLRNGCPYELRCLAFEWTENPRELEARLHTRFARSRLRGEWFAPERALVDLIADIQRFRQRAIVDLLAEVE